MNVAAFNASPRKNGNTSIMIEEALKAIESSGIETRLVHIRPNEIMSCTNCDHCRNTGEDRCILPDRLNDWLAMMVEADGILLASPTYFWGMHPTMKCLIDRVGYITRGRLRKGGNRSLLYRKVGGALSVDGYTGAPQTVQAMQAFFMVTEMIVPGGVYWPVGKGLHPGDVLRDSSGLRYARDLGENMAWLIKKIAI